MLSAFSVPAQVPQGSCRFVCEHKHVCSWTSISSPGIGCHSALKQMVRLLNRKLLSPLGNIQFQPLALRVTPGDLPNPGIKHASLYVSRIGRWVLRHLRHLDAQGTPAAAAAAKVEHFSPTAQNIPFLRLQLPGKIFSSTISAKCDLRPKPS